MRDHFIHRTLRLSASEYERSLAAALLGILGRSIHESAGIVAALNASGCRPPSGEAWTEATFTAEMERLGAYPNSSGAPLGEHPPGIVPPGAATAERPKRPPRGGGTHAH